VPARVILESEAAALVVLANVAEGVRSDNVVLGIWMDSAIAILEAQGLNVKKVIRCEACGDCEQIEPSKKRN
jgi:hypothetical protein